MMADDDWRNERRNWRGAGRRDADRWAPDDNPHSDMDRGYPSLSYGPYARRERMRTDRADRYGHEDEQARRYYGRGDRNRYNEGRFRSGGSADHGTGQTGSYDRDYGRDEDRGWLDRAGDEVASWFGDDEAEYRRRMDRQRDEGKRYFRHGEHDFPSARSRRYWRDTW